MPMGVTFWPESSIIWLVNKTGAISKKGTIARASFTYDNAFDVIIGGGIIPIGAVYDDGIPDGELCRVIRGGRAQVLLKDDTPAVRGNWVGMSDTAGRATAGGPIHPGQVPPEQEIHNGELGHCLESADAGTDVLVFINMHFN